MRPSDVRRIRRGILSVASYRSAASMFRVFVEPVQALRRYVDAGYGAYPWTTTLRTPMGRVRVQLPHPHDVRTVNEIFCRHDYGCSTPRVVVDVGANIGVSALFFLSRCPDAVVHAFEPLPANLEVLRRNLGAFGERVVLDERAVSTANGRATFLVEDVGRYSGLAEFYEHELETREITVATVDVAEVLDGVLTQEGHVDLLKVDTEGSELAIVSAVRPDQWERIREVHYEHEGRVRDRPPEHVALGWRAGSPAADDRATGGRGRARSGPRATTVGRVLRGR